MKFNKNIDERFVESYKNEMDLHSPSEEQTERIIKGVYERIERENSEPVTASKPRKKPLWIKVTAVCGTACAAALVFAVIGFGTRGLPSADRAPGFILNTNNKDEANYISGNAAGNVHPDNIGVTAENLGDSAKDEFTAAASDFSVMIAAEGAHSAPSEQDTMPVTSPSGFPKPYLSFSEDRESCTVTEVDGKITIYERANLLEFADSGSYIDTTALFITESDLGEELLVQFGVNDLYILDKSGKFFGYYKAK